MTTSRFEEFCDQHLGVVLLVASLVYFAAMAVQSSLKPLWYDEFFTLFLALLPVNRIWAATQNGAEVHPPLSAIGAHFAQAALGTTAFATRLPEIIAFWGMSIAVFFSVRRNLGSSWALAAVLFIFQSGAEYYATEARAYSIVMCCAAIALLCWQNVSYRRRWICLAGIFLSLAAAVSANFMGVLIAIPIGVGELYLTWRRRRIDAAFWIASVAGVSVLLIYLPMMRAAKRYLAHGSQALGHRSPVHALFELPLLPLVIPASTVLIVLYLSCSMFPERAFDQNAGLSELTAPPASTLLAATALFLLPLCQPALEHWTHSVNPRYTISYVIGAALLFTYGCASLFRPVKAAGLLTMFILAAAVMLGGMLQYQIARRIPQWPPQINSADLPNLPILVDQGLHLLPLYWYNPSLRDRMYFVLTAEDVTHSNGDTVELNLLSGRDWFLPVKLANRKRFFYSGSKFLFYESGREGEMLPDWQMDAFRAMHANIALAKRLSPIDVIYEVDLP